MNVSNTGVMIDYYYQIKDFPITPQTQPHILTRRRCWNREITWVWPLQWGQAWGHWRLQWLWKRGRRQDLNVRSREIRIQLSHGKNRLDHKYGLWMCMHFRQYLWSANKTCLKLWSCSEYLLHYFQDGILPSTASPTCAHSSCLSFTSVRRDQAGVYICQVSKSQNKELFSLKSIHLKL